MDKNEDVNADVKLALEEMRLNMQQTISAGDALDQKVILILTVAGIILTVSPVIQEVFSHPRPDWHLHLLAVAIVFYIITVSAALWVASPQSYRRAINANWDDLNKYIFQRPERDAILSLLSGYVDQIHYNSEVNFRKVKALRLSIGILLFTIIILSILILSS